jgi:hypothetical protein
MLHFLGGQVVGLVLGFLVGAFTPSIGRSIKHLFSSAGKKL